MIKEEDKESEELKKGKKKYFESVMQEKDNLEWNIEFM